jgi:hypothetical protein
MKSVGTITLRRKLVIWLTGEVESETSDADVRGLADGDPETPFVRGGSCSQLRALGRAPQAQLASKHRFVMICAELASISFTGIVMCPGCKPTRAPGRHA